MSIVPTFETERLFLRAPEERDIAAWQRHFAHWDVVRYLNPGLPWPYPEDGAAEFYQGHVKQVQGKSAYFWGLFLKENPEELVGIVELRMETKLEHRGFWLAKHLWGQGLMSEALIPVNDFAFDTLGMDHLILVNMIQNKSSSHIKTKQGARLLRVQEAKSVDPEVTHEEVWELRAQDWRAYRQKTGLTHG
tara:strand:+ start:265 stop:837 length:573 start_codon:yes stop_codon:yes gene_type:complete